MRGIRNAERLTYDVAPPPSALMELTTCMHTGCCCAHSSTERRHQAENSVTSVKRTGWDLRLGSPHLGVQGGVRAWQVLGCGLPDELLQPVTHQPVRVLALCEGQLVSHALEAGVHGFEGPFHGCARDLCRQLAGPGLRGTGGLRVADAVGWQGLVLKGRLPPDCSSGSPEGQDSSRKLQDPAWLHAWCSCKNVYNMRNSEFY